MGIVSKLVIPPQARLAAGLISAAAFVLLVLVLRWHWIGEGRNQAELDHAHAQERADAIQREHERKRDAAASRIAADSNHAAGKATTKTKEATRARHQQIDAVPATGACRMPDGMPDLAPAVDAANAARREAVQEGRYGRRHYRSMAEGGRGADGSVREGDGKLGERHARDPDPGAPAPAG